MARRPDIFAELGEFALASRLRRLSETMMAEGEELYRDLGISFKPKWFPAFYALSKRSPLAVGELAAELGVSHTAVAKIAAEMQRAGLVRAASDGRGDKRRSLYALTPAGKRTLRRLGPVWREIGKGREGDPRRSRRRSAFRISSDSSGPSRGAASSIGLGSPCASSPGGASRSWTTGPRSRSTSGA